MEPFFALCRVWLLLFGPSGSLLFYFFLSVPFLFVCMCIPIFLYVISIARLTVSAFTFRFHIVATEFQLVRLFLDGPPISIAFYFSV